MKYQFSDPICEITEISSKNPDFVIKINLPKIAKDENRKLLIDCSGPGDKVHWVTVYIKKKVGDDSDGKPLFDVKPIDVRCESCEQVTQFIADIQSNYDRLIDKFHIQKTKPWLLAELRQQYVKKAVA